MRSHLDQQKLFMKHTQSEQPLGLGQIRSQRGVVSAVELFALAAVLGAVLLAFVFHLLFTIDRGNVIAVVLCVSLYLVASAFTAIQLNRNYPHNELGWCNLVTLLRLVLVGVLGIVVLVKIVPSWTTFALAIITLCLDGVDGWFARKQGLVSTFGARFDVEVDACLALVLAIYAATNGAAGLFVVLLGLPHYVFWIAQKWLPWLRQDLPARFSRKVVCVFQIVALAALQLPVVSGGQLNIIIAVVTLALMWSFGRDIVWLRRAAS